jgi:hypothetical protein
MWGKAEQGIVGLEIQAGDVISTVRFWDYETLPQADGEEGEP